jgi:hypothetical protein
MTVSEFDELEKRLQELAARFKGEEVIPESDIKIADMSPLQAYNAGYIDGEKKGRRLQREKDAVIAEICKWLSKKRISKAIREQEIE